MRKSERKNIEDYLPVGILGAGHLARLFLLDLPVYRPISPDKSGALETEE